MTEEDEEFNRIERESMMRMKAVQAVVTRGGSRTTIEMAREAAGDDWGLFQEYMPEIHRLVELVRADERNSWPSEMEAMERQVNILTDALAEEREACAKVCEELLERPSGYQGTWEGYGKFKTQMTGQECAAAIRNRSNT